jgi:hypothetical protein
VCPLKKRRDVVATMRKGIMAGLVLLFSYTGTLAGELAKEGSYDMTFCYAGDSFVIAHSQTHIAFSVDLGGTTVSHPSGGLFDLNSFPCVGAGSVIDGVVTGAGFCEGTDADKDKMFGRYIRTGTKGSWEFLAGTGKYTGITGGGPWEDLGRFPPVKPGRTQA